MPNICLTRKMQASRKKSKYFFWFIGNLVPIGDGIPHWGWRGNSTWCGDPGFELRRGVELEGRTDPGIENHALQWGYSLHGLVILGSSFESGYNSRGVLTQESKIIHYSEGIVCFCSLMNLVPISDPARENEGIILWISNKCPKFVDPWFDLRIGVQFEGRTDPGIENHALQWGYSLHGLVILG